MKIKYTYSSTFFFIFFGCILIATNYFFFNKMSHQLTEDYKISLLNQSSYFVNSMIREKVKEMQSYTNNVIQANINNSDLFKLIDVRPDVSMISYIKVDLLGKESKVSILSNSKFSELELVDLQNKNKISFRDFKIRNPNDMFLTFDSSDDKNKKLIIIYKNKFVNSEYYVGISVEASLFFSGIIYSSKISTYFLDSNNSFISSANDELIKNFLLHVNKNKINITSESNNLIDYQLGKNFVVQTNQSVGNLRMISFLNTDSLLIYKKSFLNFFIASSIFIISVFLLFFVTLNIHFFESLELVKKNILSLFRYKKINNISDSNQLLNFSETSQFQISVINQYENFYQNQNNKSLLELFSNVRDFENSFSKIMSLNNQRKKILYLKIEFPYKVNEMILDQLIENQQKINQLISNEFSTGNFVILNNSFSKLELAWGVLESLQSDLLDAQSLVKKMFVLLNQNNPLFERSDFNFQNEHIQIQLSYRHFHFIICSNKLSYVEIESETTF